MKKKYSILAVIVLMITIGIQAHAAVTVNDKAGLLSALEIVPQDFSESSISEVTRGQFAQSIVNLWGQKELAQGYSDSPSPYFDIYSTSSMSNSVKLLYDSKILTPDSSGLFRPDDAIKLSEALKMSLDVVGYKEIARMNGGYPEGYMNTAMTNELLKNMSVIEKDTCLTQKDAINLLYNLLELSPMYTASREDIEYSKSTVAAEFLNIYSEQGIVDKNLYTSIYDTTNVMENEISVDGELYNISEEYDTAELLGSNVVYYYRDNDDEREIVYLEKRRTKSLTISSEDAVSFKDYTLTYVDEKDKEQKEKLEKSISVIYNGKYASSFPDEYFTPETGEIVLIDNNSDGKYEIAKITEYINYVVSGVDANNNIIYTRTNTKKFNLEDGNIYIVQDIGGALVGVDSINANMIISCAESEDGELNRLIVCNKQAQGKITSVNDDSIVIGSEEYNISKQYTGSELRVGNEGTYMLDIFGEVAYSFLGVTDNEFRYGYIIRGYLDEALESCQVKILSDDNSVSDLLLANKVYINGERYTPGTIKNSEIMGEMNKCIPQLIRYRTDSNGEINQIYTSDAQDHGMNMISSGSYLYKSSSLTFSFRTFMNGNTKLFFVDADPESSYNSSRFSVGSYDALNDGTYYTIKAYSSDSNAAYAEVVVVYLNYNASALVGQWNNLVLVKDFKTQWDESENDTVNILEGYSVNTEISRKIATKSVMENITIYNRNTSQTENVEMEIETGDVVRYNISFNGEITKLQMIYDASEKRYYGDSRVSGAFDASIALTYGYIYSSCADDTFKVRFAPIDYISGEFQEPNGITLPVNKFVATVFDDTGRKPDVHPMKSASEIKNAEAVGTEECSRVIYMTRDGIPSQLIILNQ